MFLFTGGRSVAFFFPSVAHLFAAPSPVHDYYGRKGFTMIEIA